MLTDPPYGINVIGGNKSFGSIGGNKIVKANLYQPIIGDDAKQMFWIISNFRESSHFRGKYLDLPVEQGVDYLGQEN